jgi:hypothetical protein
VKLSTNLNDYFEYYRDYYKLISLIYNYNSNSMIRQYKVEKIDLIIILVFIFETNNQFIHTYLDLINYIIFWVSK